MIIRHLTATAPEAPAQGRARAIRQTPVRWSWTANGRTWDLSGFSSPVVRLEGGLAGQVDPEHWWSEAAALPGATWDGFREGIAELFLPILVRGSTVAEFFDEHEAFMATMSPDVEGIMRCTRPDGRWRELACRFASGGVPSADWEPTRTKAITYGITWATGDPYWRGPDQVVRFEHVTGHPFYPFPPLIIGPSLSLGDATVTNLGEVGSQAIIKVEGPYTGFDVGINDRLIRMSTPKPAGGFIRIDGRTGKKSIVDESGIDLYDLATEVNFTDIPPGETHLTTSVQGAGRGTAVEVSFTPRYRRAW